MSFETLETGRVSGTPVTLYLFRFGEQDASHFAYTDHLEAIVHHDEIRDIDITYQPLAIKHENVKSSGSLDKSALKITAQRDISMRSIFLVWPPSAVVNVTIRQGHIEDPDEQFLVCFAGRVMSYDRNNSQAEMTIEPISTGMRQPGLRRFYQIGCPHWLYGPDCKASRTYATRTTTVSSKAGTAVILPNGWNGAFAKVKFRLGEARWTNSYGETELRTILAVNATTDALTLSGPLIDLDNGDAISVALGCNHKTSPIGDGIGDCTNLHREDSDDTTPNGRNYGGCKFIPLNNPIGLRNVFY